uniref:Uncharacterized protein n=1 Tax=Cacopsylla melanoneura TaxID=428564 RepID=A0A8D8X8P5_9HEMI
MHRICQDLTIPWANTHPLVIQTHQVALNTQGGVCITRWALTTPWGPIPLAETWDTPHTTLSKALCTLKATCHMGVTLDMVLHPNLMLPLITSHLVLILTLILTSLNTLVVPTYPLLLLLLLLLRTIRWTATLPPITTCLLPTTMAYHHLPASKKTLLLYRELLTQ